MNEQEWIAFHQAEFERARKHLAIAKQNLGKLVYYCEACSEMHDYTEVAKQ